MEELSMAASSQQQVATGAGAVDLAVAISAHNEAEHLGNCLRALAVAGRDLRMDVTVLLNGSTDRSPEVATATMRETGLAGKVCRIPYADKSNAFNQYAYRLRVPAPVHVFVDAYASVAPDALLLLMQALQNAPAANAAAAVPSSGRSAAMLREQMLQVPALHGSLFALREGFLDRMTRLGLRLPLNFYRGDGLLSSLVLHDLDALNGGWQHHRLVVEPRATWTVPETQLWRSRDARRQWRRRVQQARGHLQWYPVKAAIYDAGFAALPSQADQATLAWLNAMPAARHPRWWRDPFAMLAIRRMRAQPPAPPQQDLLPHTLMQTTP
jgi:glycosyltransferase involved in cell wall biosynthesis